MSNRLILFILVYMTLLISYLFSETSGNFRRRAVNKIVLASLFALYSFRNFAAHGLALVLLRGRLLPALELHGRRRDLLHRKLSVHRLRAAAGQFRRRSRAALVGGDPLCAAVGRLFRPGEKGRSAGKARRHLRQIPRHDHGAGLHRLRAGLRDGRHKAVAVRRGHRSVHGQRLFPRLPSLPPLRPHDQVGASLQQLHLFHRHASHRPEHGAVSRNRRRNTAAANATG